MSSALQKIADWQCEHGYKVSKCDSTTCKKLWTAIREALDEAFDKGRQHGAMENV